MDLAANKNENKNVIQVSSGNSLDRNILNEEEGVSFTQDNTLPMDVLSSGISLYEKNFLYFRIM